MKRKIIYVATLVASLFTTSCNSWLDVAPVDETSSAQMYATTKGFYNVLNGIYLDIGKQELYGMNLSWGAMEAWGNSYRLDKSLSEHETFYSLKEYNYNDRGVQSLRNTIWQSAYKNIARTNDFLQHAEKKESSFFTNGEIEHKLLMGEARALRAMLHFDMLRVFGQSIAIEGSLDKAYIPYVTTYPSRVNPPIPTKKVLELIKEDLEYAYDMVSAYDAIPDNLQYLLSSSDRFSTSSEPEWGRFYSQRGSRLNILAISLLRARVALYEQNYEAAEMYAQTILDLVDSKKLQLEASSAIKTNPKMMKEVLFGFYNSRLVSMSENYFDRLMRQKLLVEDIVLFVSVATDKRADLLENYIPTIYREDKNGAFQNYVPAIKISEAYYIVAECMVERGDLSGAITLLNSLMKSRGISASSLIPSDVTEEEYMTKLIDDARKEFVGLGQIIFWYKRLNIPVKGSTGEIGQSVGNLVMPLPDSESAV